MKQLRIIVVVILLLLVSCQLQQIEALTISENGRTKIDQQLQGAIGPNKIPGVVAIVANKDTILYHQGFGKLEVTNNIDMPKDAIFSIASMTKPVTSVAIMILREEGRLDLEDPISKYIPSLANPEVITHFNETDTTYTTVPAANEITIRHLLSHTSGFGYAFSSHILHHLQQKTGKAPRNLPLLHEPGSKWTYGMSTEILGELIEEITGKSLYDFLKAKILDPLGMDDTFCKVPEEKYGRVVTKHARRGKRIDFSFLSMENIFQTIRYIIKVGTLIEQPKPKAEDQRIYIDGGGGLRSTAEDYITFLQMFLNKGTLHNKKILSEGSIDLMTQNQIGELVVEEQPGAIATISNAFPFGAGRDKFGLGFQITVSTKENRNLRSPGSYSWAGIRNTHFWVDPEKEIAAVIMMQVLPFYDETCIKAYQDFEKLIYSNLQ